MTKFLETTANFESCFFHWLARQTCKRCENGEIYEAVPTLILSWTAFQAFIKEFQYLIGKHKESQHNTGYAHLPRYLINTENCSTILDYHDKISESITGHAVNNGTGIRQDVPIRGYFLDKIQPRLSGNIPPENRTMAGS